MPAVNDYAVYLTNHSLFIEPAGAGKALIPPGFSCEKENVNKLESIFSYKLKDLDLGNITSNSWNSILAYSGEIIDILVLQNAKHPPYNERELNINKWINGEGKYEILKWNSDKVENNDKKKFVKFIETIEVNLS